MRCLLDYRPYFKRARQTTRQARRVHEVDCFSAAIQMEHLTYLFTRIQISLEESKIKGFLLKPKQVKALDFLLIGKDVISVLPTGYGKSLIYISFYRIYTL